MTVRPSALLGTEKLRAIAVRLQQIAKGESSDAETLLRREAAWYAAESESVTRALLAADEKDDPARSLLPSGQLFAKLANEPKVFGDLVALKPLLDDVQATEAALRPPAREGKTWRENFYDSARSPVLHGRFMWANLSQVRAPDSPDWIRLLSDNVSPQKPPRTLAWRALTKQIAEPTLELLREALYTPWSARVIWIEDGFRAAGDSVIQAVCELCEATLDEARTRSAHLVVAKRCAMLLGALAAGRDSSLQLLTEQLLNHAVPPEVAAECAVSLGLLAKYADGQSIRARAEVGLRQAAEAAVWELQLFLGDSTSATPGTGRLVVAQAAIYALSMLDAQQDFMWQHLEVLAELNAELGTRAESQDDLAGGSYALQTRSVSGMAQWAASRLEANITFTSR